MESWSCSQCGAANSATAGSCWLCRISLVRQAEPAAGAPAAPARAAGAGRTFGLSSLMILVALIAVCLGVRRESPGLGIALAVVSTPAMVRTVFAARRREITGRPMSTGEKAVAFLGSIGVVVTVCAASGAAFVATCFPIGLATFNVSSGGGGGIVLAFGLGILAAIAVAALLFRRLWPRKD